MISPSAPRNPAKPAFTVILIAHQRGGLALFRLLGKLSAGNPKIPGWVDAELGAILAMRPDLAVVAIADGVEENWRTFDRPLYAHATRVVDHGHPCDHLRDAMRAYYGEKSVEGRAQYARLRIILRDQPGGVDEVITERGRLARKMGGQRRKARRKRLRSELTSFQKQRFHVHAQRCETATRAQEALSVLAKSGAITRLNPLR